jgi:NitT/TauT family transport system substrate-binding protein
MLERGLTRRRFLARAAEAGMAVAASGTLLAACGGGSKSAGEPATVRWISPRGSLVVMDDYDLWVPQKMGYFRDLAITAVLGEGPGKGELTFLAERKADMGYPPPGELASSIAGGIPVISIWNQYPAQIFDFSLPRDSAITTVEELAGTRISVPTAGWKPIVDPILVEAGVDPSSVELVENGVQWNLDVAQGKADAGLAWEGLRAQLMGRGLKLRYLLGSSFSQGPSNAYAVRRADLDDDARRDAYTRFLQGVVMGLEFARRNPRAAAQITYRAVPGLPDRIGPQIAVDALLQISAGYAQEERRGSGWGYHDEAAWRAYLDVIHRLGQLRQELAPEDVLTNDLVEAANAGADVERARGDADGFELDKDFAKATLSEEAS